jgi:hypothetical protein
MAHVCQRSVHAGEFPFHVGNVLAEGLEAASGARSAHGYPPAVRQRSSAAEDG